MVSLPEGDRLEACLGAVRDVCLAVDARLSDERMAAVARVLAIEGYTDEDLHVCTVRLSSDAQLARDLNFDKDERGRPIRQCLTPADFARVRPRDPFAHILPEARQTMKRMAAQERADLEAGRNPYPQAIPGDALLPPKQKALPPKREYPEGYIKPDPTNPRCPVHDREMINGDFCAACEVEKVKL